MKYVFTVSQLCRRFAELNAAFLLTGFDEPLSEAEESAIFIDQVKAEIKELKRDFRDFGLKTDQEKRRYLQRFAAECFSGNPEDTSREFALSDFGRFALQCFE